MNFPSCLIALAALFGLPLLTGVGASPHPTRVPQTAPRPTPAPVQGPRHVQGPMPLQGPRPIQGPPVPTNYMPPGARNIDRLVNNAPPLFTPATSAPRTPAGLGGPPPGFVRIDGIASPPRFGIPAPSYTLHAPPAPTAAVPYQSQITRKTSFGAVVGSVSFSENQNGVRGYGASANAGLGQVGLAAKFALGGVPDALCMSGSSTFAPSGPGASGGVQLCVDVRGDVKLGVGVGPAVAAPLNVGGTEIGMTYSVQVTRDATLFNIGDVFGGPPSRTYFDTPRYWAR